MIIDKKKFKRIKNKVLKKYPLATTKVNSDGTFYVSDGDGNNLINEYMIPPQKSVALAWYWLAETIRVDQNINRTHPDKLAGERMEKRFFRISKRNLRDDD